MKIMTFHLPDGDYAVELSAVVEVLRARGAAGTTLADRALPLLDLADRLGLERGIGEDAPAVVLRSAEGEAGMRVGSVWAGCWICEVASPDGPDSR